MSEGLKPWDPAVVGLIQGSFGPDGIALPFVQEIFLMQCHVAGTTHSEVEEFDEELNITDILIFRREPDNSHDELAIMIHDKSGRKIGYVPRAKNEVLARLMDAGKLVFGKLETKQWLENWLKVEIRVFMRDI